MPAHAPRRMTILKLQFHRVSGPLCYATPIVHLCVCCGSILVTAVSRAGAWAEQRNNMNKRWTSVPC
eukprot:14096193-Alexandrium_andersonii.AAC.1